jgi:hypothetical protein
VSALKFCVSFSLSSGAIRQDTPLHPSFDADAGYIISVHSTAGAAAAIRTTVSWSAIYHHQTTTARWSANPLRLGCMEMLAEDMAPVMEATA